MTTVAPVATDTRIRVIRKTDIEAPVETTIVVVDVPALDPGRLTVIGTTDPLAAVRSVTANVIATEDVAATAEGALQARGENLASRNPLN